MARPRTNFPSMGGHDGSHLKYAATVDFSRKLRRLMATRHMSQSDLARECWGEEETADGYMAARGRDKINRYVTGRTMPDAESLTKLAKALEGPEAELAPTVVGSALEREQPETRMTMTAGHREHVPLPLEGVRPLGAAVKIMAIFEQHQPRGPDEDERNQPPPPLSPDVLERVRTALKTETLEEQRMK